MPIMELGLFHGYTEQWFHETLGEPTEVQKEAWPAISGGSSTLVSAPTGTGKTLSAFLVFIDRLIAQAVAGTLKQELQVIYISPLKSLAGDIRQNLRRPLSGIAAAYEKQQYREEQTGEQLKRPKNSPEPETGGEGTVTIDFHNRNRVTVGIRTGDTTQAERRKMIKTPPHILITTPESLYLMLTSKSGKKILETAKTVIIDELHALIDTKRGAHLMLSLARLDKLCMGALQRIGLSATIEPLSEAASYLSAEPAEIISPKMHKKIKLVIEDPLAGSRKPLKESVWQEIAARLYDYCRDSRSVIAFVEGRMYAERLAYFINQLGGDGFARAHHGSLSKEQRFAVEDALRSGRLRLLCATSSMELGIDVGEIDQVFQIGCPRTISSTMQRLGRAGHSPDRVSVMHIFPRADAEALYCGLTAEVAREGGVEHSKPPKLCLDVLAQHLVSMAEGGYTVEEVLEILARAWPFAEVTKEDVKDVLGMLAGDYEHEQNIPVRPRILYDRLSESVAGDAYSRMLAVSTGGTIPDKGLYAAKTEEGIKLGELDEEFVFESRVGDAFLLGTFSWQISSIQKDSVVVRPSARLGARLPFWKGDIKGRQLKTGLAFGRILRRLSEAAETGNGALQEALCGLGLEKTIAKGTAEFFDRQLQATGAFPDDRTILVEHFRDETETRQIMVHSVFGRQVNTPLSILACQKAKELLKTNINYVEDEDGFLLFPYEDCAMPERLLQQIDPASVQELLELILPATPLFNMVFRYNAARALMMGVRKSGRQPLWVQRMRSAQMLETIVKQERHPLMRETRRECLEDYWDLEGVKFVLNGIRAGTIQVYEFYSENPSPLTLPYRRQTESSQMYNYTPTPFGLQKAVEETIAKDGEAQLVKPSAESLQKAAERRKMPEDPESLHTLLMIEGDLAAGDLKVPVEWLETLAGAGRVLYVEPGLWIAAEHSGQYEEAFREKGVALRQVLLRALRYRGAFTAEQLSDRYLLAEVLVQGILKDFLAEGSAEEEEGIFFHGELYRRARRETVSKRRQQIKTVPGAHYAALLAGRLHKSGTPSDLLEEAMQSLCGKSCPAAWWESVLLPVRTGNYRAELLDALLARGGWFWRVQKDRSIRFYRYEEIDWEAEPEQPEAELNIQEKEVYGALKKRGASFPQSLSALLKGASPYDALIGLAEKGLVCADSFLPVRQLLNQEKPVRSSVRQRVGARAKLLSAGRFELVRPVISKSVEEQLEELFDRVMVVCRETVDGLSWGSALETLRVWEYTGRARRGYFVEGLSGIQFIRENDFAGVSAALDHPEKEIIWLPACDPLQPWGKSLSHEKERQFMNLPGTAVALYAGEPAAVLERQGKQLRVFCTDIFPEVLAEFIKEYRKRRIFTELNRIVIKEYPKEAEEALQTAGFQKEIQDYVLYRTEV